MAAINKINDIRSLKRFIPLNELEYDKLSELIENSSVLQFKKSQPITTEVEKTQSVYLLAGNVVRAPNSDRAQLIKASDSQACQAIMTPVNRPRMVADNSVTVLCIDTELLDFLLNWGADDGVLVDEINTDEGDEWVDGLLRSEAILSLSPQSIQTLMAVVEPVEFNANETVFNQGDKPDYYYIVSSGNCVVTRREEKQGVSTELARLGPGDAFGEDALIANCTRSASVRMNEDGLLLRLDQRNFKKLLEQSLVKTISAERANRLKAKDAVVLDLRSAAEFSKGGCGINIPFAELRSRMPSLDKDGKYIVVSNDNNLSAIGAFLLSKKCFKVYLLKTAIKNVAAVSGVKVDVKVAQLESTVSQMQQGINLVNAKFYEEEKNHSASKLRIQLLESDLKNTESCARKAIVEASTLKNRSEVFFRDRIDALTCELEKQEQSSLALSIDNEALNLKLTSIQGKLGQVQHLLELKTIEASDARNREVRHDEQIKQLEECLLDLQQTHEKVLGEKRRLNNQFNEAVRNAEQQTAQMALLNDQLVSATSHIDQAERSLLESQEQLSDLEDSFKLSRNLARQAKQQLRQQEKLFAEQERVTALLTEDLRLQTQVAQRYASLRHQLESVETTLTEKESQFHLLEANYKHRVDQLEAELKQTVNDGKQLAEQELQNQILSEKLSIQQGDNKRSRVVQKLLIFVLLSLIASVGAAYYMKIDLHGGAGVLMEQVAPQIDKLFDAIPG